jgi:hypothetical protein
VATQPTNNGWSLTTTETELTEGKHYWEVELLSSIQDVNKYSVLIGISRPNLDPAGCCLTARPSESKDAWFIHATNGSLYGSDKWSK